MRERERILDNNEIIYPRQPKAFSFENSNSVDKYQGRAGQEALAITCEKNRTNFWESIC